MDYFVNSMRRSGKNEEEIAEGIEWAKATCHKKHEHPPRDTEHPIRAFDPSWNDLYRGQISDLLVLCPVCNGYYLRVVSPDEVRGKDHNAFALFIGAACRVNDNSEARAAIGVFYGPESTHNFSLVLDRTRHPDTKQRAEIQAAMSGIEQAYMTYEGKKICKILVMTDSKYLVDGISDRIWKWKENGYRNAKTGKPVVNKALFQQLHKLVAEMEEEGIDVWFWHIRKEHNRDADRLANEALDLE